MDIIAETDRWLVVNKPAGIEAHPSKPTGRRTLWHDLREVLAFELANGGQISLINRLDRETSGLTLIAKNHESARFFHLLMQQRAIEKEYLALVWGWPGQDSFELDAPILRKGSREESQIYLKQMVHPEGAPCSTSFQVVQRFERNTSNGTRFALVRCHPHTGRMHQIRVHLAHLGFPVVGDKIYGPDESCYLEFIDTGWTPALQERLLLPRHALHSTRMQIASHNLDWHCPLPADMESFMAPAQRLC